MKFACAFCLLLLFPALSLNTRQSYEGLEQRLKDVFAERTGILRQLSKTSKELDGIKGNLQSLKNDETVAKKDVQRVLELSQKQREEMKSLQAALQKQLDEATERAEKQQATINFLKAEMERKSKIIKDLQQENKSLKSKLLSGNKLCGIHAEESKKIQAQLKELRYGKKDLVFKGQQLMDLERKLLASKEELEKAALDKESQLKALKDTVHLCFSSVLQNHPPTSHALLTAPSHLHKFSALANSSRVTFQQPHAKNIPKMLRIVTSKTPTNMEMIKRDNMEAKGCHSEKVAKTCFQNQTEKWSPMRKTAEVNLHDQQKSQEQPTAVNDIIRSSDDNKKEHGGDRGTVMQNHN